MGRAGGNGASFFVHGSPARGQGRCFPCPIAQTRKVFIKNTKKVKLHKKVQNIPYFQEDMWCIMKL